MVFSNLTFFSTKPIPSPLLQFMVLFIRKSNKKYHLVNLDLSSVFRWSFWLVGCWTI